MCSLILLSLLTTRAVVGRTLSLRQLTHGCATFAAGLLGALVDVKFLPEIPWQPICAHIVTQRSTANTNRHTQHRAHRPRQSRHLGSGKTTRLAARPDFGAKQRFAGVDVSNTNNEFAVHEKLLDGDPPSAGGSPQVLRIECIIERLRRQV